MPCTADMVSREIACMQECFRLSTEIIYLVTFSAIDLSVQDMASKTLLLCCMAQYVICNKKTDSTWKIGKKITRADQAICNMIKG